MIILENSNYRIESYNGLPKRFAVDFKEKKDGRVCLVNVGWYDWRHEAVQAMNQHAEAKR